MNQQTVASAAAVFGVVLFFVSLYGGFGGASPMLALAGFGTFVVALVAALWQVRLKALVAPHPVVVAGAALGALLHAYEQYARSSSASFGGFLWSLLPYCVCLAASVFPTTRVPAIGGMLAALVVDGVVHYEVFVHPSGSTAALALLFAPLWSALVFSPLAMLGTWLVLTLHRRHLRRSAL